MKRTPFALLHPAARIVILVAALVILTSFNDPTFAFILTLAVVIAAAAFCGARDVIWKAGPLAAAFIVLSCALWPPFIKSGTALFRIGGYVATETGVRYGLAVGLRITGMLFAGLAFLKNTPAEEFTDALQTFRLPTPITVAVSLTFRLIPVFYENVTRALEAQRARGLPFGKNFFTQMRHIIPLVAPVFLYSLRSVDQMATALDLRGYRAGRRPAPWPPRPWMMRDNLAVLAVVVLLVTAVGLRLAGFGTVLPGRL